MTHNELDVQLAHTLQELRNEREKGIIDAVSRRDNAIVSRVLSMESKLTEMHKEATALRDEVHQFGIIIHAMFVNDKLGKLTDEEQEEFVKARNQHHDRKNKLAILNLDRQTLASNIRLTRKQITESMKREIAYNNEIFSVKCNNARMEYCGKVKELIMNKK